MKFLKVLLILVIILLLVAIIATTTYVIWTKESNRVVYYAKDFGIEVLKSKNDEDGDGIDDYTDILEGAKLEAERKPRYKSEYYVGGYPPDDEGVWKA